MAQDLVGKREYDPQEIEFTFESAAGKDLYILQKRAMVQEQRKDSAVLRHLVAQLRPAGRGGHGRGRRRLFRPGGHQRRADRRAAREAPDENIVLLRPDTVPEDIAMITRV